MLSKHLYLQQAVQLRIFGAFTLIHRFQNTLLVQDFRQQKNQPLPIQHSRPSRDSQEPKTTKKNQFSRWLFQKIPFLYFFLYKSWIWRTLGHVMNIFSKWHFHNASKEYFWSKKIEIFQLFQVPMNLTKAWNTKLEVASFFAV